MVTLYVSHTALLLNNKKHPEHRPLPRPKYPLLQANADLDGISILPHNDVSYSSVAFLVT